MTISISTGTDNLGVNLVYACFIPSANVNFGKIDISSNTSGNNHLPTTEVLYTEPIGFVALRGLGVSLTYIPVFLFIAWFAFKKSQINE